MTTSQITGIDRAKKHYLGRLGATWDMLHDNAELDFESGWNAGSDEGLQQFKANVGDDPMADLRIEDFTAGRRYARGEGTV